MLGACVAVLSEGCGLEGEGGMDVIAGAGQGCVFGCALMRARAGVAYLP